MDIRNCLCTPVFGPLWTEAAMNVHRHVFAWRNCFISLGWILRSTSAGSYCRDVSTFIKYSQMFSKMVVSSCTPISGWPRRAGWQHIPAPALGIVTLLNVGRCLGTSMSLGFRLHFSEDWRCWASCHVLVAIQTSFMRCLHVFSSFNFIFSLTCKNSLYILDKALCLSFLQIFSVGLWFFAKQRFSFMCSSRSFRS